MDAEDLLRDSDETSESEEEEKAKKARKERFTMINKARRGGSKESRDYVEVGRDARVGVKRNGVIELKQKNRGISKQTEGGGPTDGSGIALRLRDEEEGGDQAEAAKPGRKEKPAEKADVKEVPERADEVKPAKMVEDVKGDKQVKKEITSLDLRFLVREIRQRLAGGVFRKIYQYGGRDTKQMIFGFFIPAKRVGRGTLFEPTGKGAGQMGQGGAKGKDVLLYVDNRKLFLTTKKEPAPQEPASFCMFLRKHLMGKRIKDVVQHGFDRIIELHTQDNIVIFELFSKGNVILCDSSYNIIMPMEIQKWRHREVKPKQPYHFPPSQNDPFSMSPGPFYRTITKSDKNVIATLATLLALGPVYAKEICNRAGVDGTKAANSVTAAEASKLQDVLLQLDNTEPEPCVYSNIVSPFPMASISENPKIVGSFSDALDEFFSFQMLEIKKGDTKRVIEKEIEKVERIVDKQAEASKKWTRIAEDSKVKADMIYNYYTTVDAVMKGIQKAKDSGLSWRDIKRKIKTEPTPEAESIKEIREGDRTVVLDLRGKEIEVDFTKTAEENAAKYYEDAKWAKGKIAGAIVAMEETGKKLEDIREGVQEKELGPVPKPGLDADAQPKEQVGEQPKLPVGHVEEDGGQADQITVAPKPPQPAEKPKKIKKRWYEFYRWFVSSDGLVVIAGKNAQQNENIIKKRLEPGDLVFHSDIQGASFVIIKSGGKTIQQETIREASEFAAAHSKAWAKGLGKVNVFAAKPEQVSKANEQGANAPKGAFFINGERSWFKDVPIKLAIGVWINREESWAKIIAGPLMPVRKLAKYFVTLRPGFTRSPELAASIKRNLLMKATPDDKYFIEQVPLEDFQGQIPSGMSDMIEGAGDF